MPRHATEPRNQRARALWQAGRACAAQQQWQRAAEAYDKATQLAPREALYWLNLSRARLQCGAIDGAAQAARQAQTLDTASAIACRLLAECAIAQHRHDDAVAAFEALDAGAPRDHDFHAAHGNALFLARRPQEAIEVFFKALALKIDAALVHYRLGLCFKDLNMRAEATECFRTTIALDSGSLRVMALSLLEHERRQSCDWDGLEADTQALLDAIDALPAREGHLVSPFALLAMPATAAQQLKIGRLRAQALSLGVKPFAARVPAARRPGPIRLGYVSADFCQHATAVLMAEMLERRDRTRFEVTLYSHSPDDGSAIGARVRAACEHFVDITALSNEAAARRMHADEIDILIDLKGHTRDSRFELLAWRPAPVQAAWLGYPASTGADFIDYLIGDRTVTPLEHATHFSEHIAQLPHSYQPNDRQRALPTAPTRAALGLPDDAVVLCCFNQAYKISPAMLDLWARILAGAPKALLWLLAWNPHAEQRLLAELARRGIGRERVRFAPKLGLDAHIARLRAADLFLDTWPCNAHTTASEALWAGVPVLTVPGETFASRVAASLVTACDLPELARADADDYVATAIALANEGTRLAAMKRQLDTERLALPLFDTDRLAAEFDTLLVRMFARWQAGLALEALPAHA